MSNIYQLQILENLLYLRLSYKQEVEKRKHSAAEEESNLPPGGYW